MDNLSFILIEVLLVVGIVGVTAIVSYLKIKRRSSGGAPAALLDSEIKQALPPACNELEDRVFIQDQEIESLRFSLRTAEQTYLFWRHIAEKRAELLAELKARNER